MPVPMIPLANVPNDKRPAGRWGVKAKRNQRGQVGFLIVDLDDNDKAIGAVMPESKNDKHHPITRRRRAWAIALDLHALDLETAAELEASDPAKDND
ncbi:hypothetical protein [Sinimarinibacterium flocculans]|uniref:hypothetical protein n=1 Tax=Sinimarinibacterium flocculans TaxID=985250 RepID=UPI002490D617|nr:hypothetical protein [Sinimarinibacterium flocculans]